MTKLAVERARMYPLSHGGHSPVEVAGLLAEGKSRRDIVALWGLRPRNGLDDLKWQIAEAWEQAGEPGGIVRPTATDPYGPEWDHWRKVRDHAIDEWLRALAENRPVTGFHCQTCRCVRT